MATRPDGRDAPHLFGLGLEEVPADEITTELRTIRDRAIRDAAAGTPKIRDSAAVAPRAAARRVAALR